MKKRGKLTIVLITILLTITMQVLLFNFHMSQVDRTYTEVKEQLTTYAATLNAVFEDKESVLHGIISYFNSIDDRVSQEAIDEFVKDQFISIPEAKTLIIAPNGMIKYAHPIEGNENLIGTNYVLPSSISTKENIVLSIDTRQASINSLQPTMQNDSYSIARHASYDEGKFKGIVTVILDTDMLLAKAATKNFLSLNPTFAIKNATDGVWFGNPETFANNPIKTYITFLHEKWELAVVPDKDSLALIWRNTIVLELLGCVTIFVVAYSYWRQSRFNLHLERLVDRRTRELRKANRDLLKAEGELRLQNELLEKRTKELEISERKFEQLAHLDSLTGISNRLHFTKYLDSILILNQHSHKKVGLFYFDLNEFKEVNDTLGHPVGDKLLTAIADRIKHSTLQYQHFARTGGDEFILVFTEIEDVEHAQDIADRILDLFTLPFKVGHTEINITSSIGISLFPDDGQTPEEMMKHADLAMYEAKAQGGNQYKMFDQGMLKQLLGRTEMELDLTRAIAEDQLLLHYQPIVEVETEKIIGLEALVRWRHPTKGMISPSEFIPLAEETGLINPLTDWVLHEVCRQHQEWLQRGLPPIKISLNISGLWFFKKRREQDFYQVLHQYDIDTRYIEIEITERLALMDDYYPILAQMLSDGISVSVDDFGIEYSSLSYLKRFPVNKIKIDQSFIRGIGKANIDETIIKAIIYVANELKYDVVAEGVETEQQAQFLLEHGCRYVQGYLFYRPLSPRELEPILREKLVTTSHI